MPLDVKVPAAGESITSANVACWHKKDGQLVKKGDVLVTLETDKVSNELEADGDGILKIIVPEGEEVGIGTVIAHIEQSATKEPPQADSQPVSPFQPISSPPVASPFQPVAPPVEPASPIDSAIEIRVPAAGESITSANIATWKKKDGENVTKGEVLVSLDTDKVSNDLEAEATGQLTILVPEGQEVPIGTVIGTIQPADARVASDAAASPATPLQSDSATTTSAQIQKTELAPAASSTFSAPAKAAEAERQKPNLALVSTPVEVSTAAQNTDGRTTRKKMSMLRRKIATHLVNAQQTAAILTTFNEVDMSAIMDLRKQVQEDFLKKHGVKLGFMSFFVKAVTQALKDVPTINGRIEGNEVIENHFYDIGVAIGSEKGLVVPILRDADKKSFAEIEKEIVAYAQKAKEGKITLEDLTGGVFTISNGGTYGSLLSTPILNPPQSGILGMHTIQQRPVALNGQVVIRPMMYLALSYDHRLVDGKEAVTFLIRIKESLENPTRLLLEM